jgi:hypothetical protein
MAEMKRNIELQSMLAKAEKDNDTCYEHVETQREEIVLLYTAIDVLERKIAELKKEDW